jgi:hypothetical protein
MRDLRNVVFVEDNGGRRSGLDRRRLWIPAYYPERRSGQDRRNGLERRSGKASFLDLPEPKRKTDTYIEFLGTVRGLFFGVCLGALLWGITIMLITFIRTS